MNTFSIAVSKRLMEIGVEDNSTQGVFVKYKPTHEWHYWVREVWYIGGGVEKGKKLVEYAQAEYFSAYTLHDILRLMPKIGEKMGWGYRENGGGQLRIEAKDPKERKEIAREWGIKSDTTVYTEKFVKAFMRGDYPEAEKVLLDLLKEHE